LARSAAAIEQLFQPILAETSPEAIRAAFIAYARKGIADFIARQEDKPEYIIKVNGVTATSEDALGLQQPATITYELLRLPQVARYALLTAIAMSPKGPTGRYKNAWFLLVDNTETSVDQIPRSAREIILVNDEPYARKINVRGAKRQGVPPGIVERIRQLVLHKFGSFVDANIEFHTLRGGYILRTNTARHRAGEEMTYPTLVMRSKI
jgi:hypothetical protein